jgi:hypothetical protein
MLDRLVIGPRLRYIRDRGLRGIEKLLVAR